MKLNHELGSEKMLKIVYKASDCTIDEVFENIIQSRYK